MDIGSILGIVGGMILIILSILVGGGDLGAFINIPSLITVMGGTFAALIIAFPFQSILRILSISKIALNEGKIDFVKIISALVSFSEKARREGLLALEDDIEEVDNSFLKKGVQLVVDGTDPELVRAIMMIDLSKIEDRHVKGKDIFDMAGAFAPAFGMIGTLMGLITMLANLTDKASIGLGMSLALITTFYGAILSNLIFQPMAKKLQIRSENEILLREIILEGTLSIQSGDNPRVLKDKLIAFLSPAVRDKISEAIEV